MLEPRRRDDLFFLERLVLQERRRQPIQCLAVLGEAPDGSSYAS